MRRVEPSGRHRWGSRRQLCERADYGASLRLRSSVRAVDFLERTVAVRTSREEELVMMIGGMRCMKLHQAATFGNTGGLLSPFNLVPRASMHSFQARFHRCVRTSPFSRIVLIDIVQLRLRLRILMVRVFAVGSRLPFPPARAVAVCCSCNQTIEVESTDLCRVKVKRKQVIDEALEGVNRQFLKRHSTC